MTLTDQLLDYGEAHARRILLEEGNESLTPFYHLVTPGAAPDAIIPCQWLNDREKELMVICVKEVSREIGAIAALFMSESWLVIMQDDEWKRRDGHFDPPAEDPRRIEVVTILVTDGKTVLERTLRMIRDKPGGKLLELTEEVKEEPRVRFSGRMIDGIIFPPDEAG